MVRVPIRIPREVARPGDLVAYYRRAEGGDVPPPRRGSTRIAASRRCTGSSAFRILAILVRPQAGVAQVGVCGLVAALMGSAVTPR
jgi:hypothetical protein